MKFIKQKNRQTLYFIPEKKNMPAFSNHLKNYIYFLKKEPENLILLCIGTDKITGDCLGPLTGSALQKSGCPLPVYGTLDAPVHAGNLPEMLSKIRSRHRRPFLLVVDAAVGAKEHVGQVTLCAKPLYPGTGVFRPLPPVGNISVTGIVHEASADSEFLLPCTGFYLVDRLAKYIADGIMRSLLQIYA